MLTQGPIPDPKCKSNISSFLTVPHLSDCLICTRNSVSIVFLLELVGRWHRCGVVDFITGRGRGDKGCVLSCSFCFFSFHQCFCCLFSHVLCRFVLRNQSTIAVVCFFVLYFFSLSLVLLTRSYLHLLLLDGLNWIIVFSLCLVPLTRSDWSREIVVSVM